MARPAMLAPSAGPDLGEKAKPAAVVEGEHVEVTVARGHTLVADPWDGLGRGAHYGPGEKALVPERDVKRLLALGVINAPQTGAEPLIAEPPPIEQPVPKVETAADQRVRKG